MTFSCRGFLLLCLLSFGPAQAQQGPQDPKEDAVQRVVRAHDPSIFVVTGALFFKQEAIRAAGGKPLSPAVQSEVERLIDTNASNKD
jgi:hypothetical protein